MDPLSSRTQRTLALLAAGVALVAVGGCTSDASPRSGPAAAPEGQPRVLFQGRGATHLLVGVAGLDGSDITYPLEDLPGGDQTNPDWSPDGSRIVLVVSDGARDDLWVADADGGNAEMLLDCRDECRYLDDPAWSPDGAAIAYSRRTARGRDGVGSLETVDVATGAVTEILPKRLRTFTAGARWSPDGSRIVFESVHTVSRRLDADVDGVSLRVVTVGSHARGPALTEPELFAATADWSPDGQSIVYSALARPDAAEPDLFVIPADGGQPQQVTTLGDSGGYAAEPTWRADSTTIVFSGGLGEGTGDGLLLTVTVDGSEPADMGAAQVIGRHPRVEPGA